MLYPGKSLSVDFGNGPIPAVYLGVGKDYDSQPHFVIALESDPFSYCECYEWEIIARAELGGN